jgi:hypothetical protein
MVAMAVVLRLVALAPLMAVPSTNSPAHGDSFTMGSGLVSNNIHKFLCSHANPLRQLREEMADIHGLAMLWAAPVVRATGLIVMAATVDTPPPGTLALPMAETLPIRAAASSTRLTRRRAVTAGLPIVGLQSGVLGAAQSSVLPVVLAVLVGPAPP